MTAPALRPGQRADAPGPADYLTEVCGLLWPRPASASLIGRRRARDRPASDRPANDMPAAGVAGRPGHSELIVLPGLRRPRLVVPAGRRPAAAAVRRYGEPGSAKTKLATRTLAIMLASGLGPVLGDRLAVRVPDGAETICSYLAQALGQPVEVSMHVGAARANRKPVLQALTPAGDTIGFAKIGINPLTADLVRAEHAALARLGEADLAGLRPPSVLGFGRWNGLDILIVSALPVWLRRTRLSATALASSMAELARSAGMSSAPFADSDYLRRLTGRLGQAGDGADQRALGRLLAGLAATAGEVRLTFGCWHGDLTPWNMASTRAGLLVWDWERFGVDVPLGFDALHYRLAARLVRPGIDPVQAATGCVATAPRLLEPFEVPPAQARLTALAYLADLSVRYVADRQADAGARLGAPGRWLIPAIETGISQL